MDNIENITTFMGKPSQPNTGQDEPYHPVYNEVYLQALREKAEQSWKDVSDTDKWLRNLRGNCDEI